MYYSLASVNIHFSWNNRPLPYLVLRIFRTKKKKSLYVDNNTDQLFSAWAQRTRFKILALY